MVLDGKLNFNWIRLFFPICKWKSLTRSGNFRKFWHLCLRLVFGWNLHRTDNLLPYFDEFLNLLYILFACILLFIFFKILYIGNIKPSQWRFWKLSDSTFSAHTVKREIQKKTAFGSGIPLLFQSRQFQLDFKSISFLSWKTKKF